MTYTRTPSGTYVAKAFGETITAHSKTDLRRLLWQAERRHTQRQAIRREQDRRFK